MKKILTFIMIALLLFGGVAFAAVETATATLKTTIGETPNNSGIRISATVPTGGDSGFDAEFLTAGSTLLLDHTSQNSEVDNVNGTFVVLVKRGSSSAITVTITANPLKNLASGAYLGYSLKSATDLITNTSTNKIVIGQLSETDTYKATTTTGALMRHVNILTYDVPIAGTGNFYGEYLGDIVFTITLP